MKWKAKVFVLIMAALLVYLGFTMGQIDAGFQCLMERGRV